MNIKPFNRYLLVSPVKEKPEEDSLSLVLPADYQRPENPHVLCDVLDVERRMLNKIDFDGKTSYLVLENYIYGRINNEIDS